MTSAFTSRELPDLDGPPPAGANPDADTSPWACEVCGQPVPPTPSGRKPRLMRCDEHRKAGATSSGGGGSSTPRAGSAHDRIATGITAIHGMVGFGVSLVAIPTGSPVWREDARVISAGAPTIGEAWAKYCDDNPRMRKAVLSFLETAGAISLVGAYAPLVIGITMNHKNATAPAPVTAPAPAPMPQAPPTPFERQPAPETMWTPSPFAPAPAAFVAPPTIPPGEGVPVFQPSMNGNGLPFATDIIE